MATRTNSTSPIHFHFRWGGTTGLNDLDYERFASRDEAMGAANALARPGEIYSVEQFDDSCEKCAAMFQPKPRSGAH